jgi:hypothetical protein
MERERRQWQDVLDAGLRLIEQRRALVDALRELSLSPSVHAILQTFVAKLAGRVDFIVEGNPDRVELADATITTAWRKFVQPLVEASLRDFAVTGVAGLFVSPYGVRRLRAEDSTWLGDTLTPSGHVRKFTMPVPDAIERYGRKWDKDAKEFLDFAELYLQHEGRLLHVCLSGEQTVVREWQDYPYDAHWLFGVERPRSNEHWATGLPVGIVEICRDWVTVAENIATAAVFRTKRARLAQLNVSSLTDMDSVDALRESFRLLPSATPNPLIVPIDEVSPAEVQVFSEMAERKLSNLTGVGLYDQNILPRGTETATEAMYYAQMGSARAQYDMERIRQWLFGLVQDFRRWLVRLPDDEVPFIRVMVGDSEEVFGRHRHIREALEGMRISLAGAGWEDVLSRLQKASMLLSLLQIAPQVVNPIAIIEEYIRAVGEDPSKFMALAV